MGRVSFDDSQVAALGAGLPAVTDNTGVSDHRQEATADVSGYPRRGLFSRTANKVAAVVLLAAVLLGLSLVLVVGDEGREYVVKGASMSPTLADGQLVLVEPGHSPQRFDIVVYKFPLDPDRRFVGRIIGVPGDLVAVRQGSVWVNRERLDETYVAEPIRYQVEPVVIRAGEYYVLGDNRNDSYDSHVWGSLPADNVVGVVADILPGAYSETGEEP